MALKGLLIFLLVCVWGLILTAIFFGVTFHYSKKECETKESPKCPQLICGDRNANDQPCGTDDSKCYGSRIADGQVIYNYAPYGLEKKQ